MYRAWALVLSVCLSGCGLSSSIIKSEAMSYDDTIEDATNKLLVLNILRARDKAPLHFADIPLIHESIQQTASLQAVFPSAFPAHRRFAILRRLSWAFKRHRASMLFTSTRKTL